MGNKLNIAVAGCGVGGLTAAALLARGGHRVTAFDQFDAPEPVGSGLVIQPVGQAALQAVGCLGALADQGHEIQRMLGIDVRAGRRVLDVRYDAAQAGRYGLALHRATLFEALLQAAQDAGVVIETASAVSGKSRGAGGMMLGINGRDVGPFDLIIDASGATSPLSPLRSRTLPFGALWATVDIAHSADCPANHLTQRYHAAYRMAGVLPIGRVSGQEGQKAAIFWSLPRSELAAWQQAPITDWQKQATTLWPAYAQFADQITSHADLTPAFYSHGTLRTPLGDGIVHIGDAAHRASPQLGQGANMALLDAWALADALNRMPLDMALEHYVVQRRWHLRLYQLMSRLLTPLYQSHSRPLAALRDHLLTPVSQIGLLQSQLAKLVCGELIFPGALVADGLTNLPPPR